MEEKIRTRYGDRVIEASVPAGWTMLGTLSTQTLPRIGREAMEEALDHPVGTRPLEGMARGRGNAVIITSDVTRPVPGDVALPVLLDRLNRAGLPHQKILVMMAGGSHKPPQDLRKAYLQKYGKSVVDRVRMEYHNPDEDLIALGKTARGHLIEIS